MATTNLVSQSYGDVLLESGSGTPDHTSPKGSIYVDIDAPTIYKNVDGATDWELILQQSKAITIEEPTASEDITMFFTDKAITISEMEAVLANGSATPSVTWTIRHSTNRNLTGSEVVTGGTVTTSITTGSIVTVFNDATIPANSWVWLETTAQSGTVPELHITIQYNED